MNWCGAGYVTSGGQSAEKPAGNETMKIAENSMGHCVVAGTTLS